MSFYVIFYYEHHYSPHKLAFQNIMQVSDQKLMINLEWPNSEGGAFYILYYTIILLHFTAVTTFVANIHKYEVSRFA